MRCLPFLLIVSFVLFGCSASQIKEISYENSLTSEELSLMTAIRPYVTYETKGKITYDLGLLRKSVEGSETYGETNKGATIELIDRKIKSRKDGIKFIKVKILQEVNADLVGKTGWLRYNDTSFADLYHSPTNTIVLFEKAVLTAAKNPKTPAAALAKIYQIETSALRVEIIKALAKHPKTSSELLRKLAEYKDQGILENVAQHKNTSAELLKILANSKYARVRENIASNKNTPSETLAILSRDTTPEVRENIARNPKTPSQILTEFANQYGHQQNMLACLAGNPGCAPEILAEFSEIGYLREHTAGNSSTPIAVLETLAQDDNPQIRKKAVATIKSLPPEKRQPKAIDPPEYEQPQDIPQEELEEEPRDIEREEKSEKKEESEDKEDLIDNLPEDLDEFDDIEELPEDLDEFDELPQ